MGGAMAIAASTHVKGLSCAVPFYGLPQAKYMHAGEIGCPVQAHFAKHDDWAKASVIEALASEAKAAGKDVSVFVYDAGHAFMRHDDPSKFDAAAAKTAWPRATKFLHGHVG
jgi:carboxymethylenebutenolidase